MRNLDENTDENVNISKPTEKVKVKATDFPPKTLSYAKIRKIMVVAGTAKMGHPVRVSKEATVKAEEFVKEYIINIGEEGAAKADSRKKKTIGVEDLEKSFINI